MAFEFVSEEAFEIYRDPHGHYHHWTVVSGRLRSGTVHRGDRIQVSGTQGISTVGYVLGFEAYHVDLGNEVTAETFSDLFGIVIWQLAPLRQKLSPEVCVECSDEFYLQTLLRLLEHDPVRIFHGCGPHYPERWCSDCEHVIARKPATIPFLQKLVEGDDSYFAKRAEVALKRYFPMP